MRVKIYHTKTGEYVDAEIKPAKKKDMPLKKDGWKFNWRELYKIEDSLIYKLVRNDVIEGVVMFSVRYEEMFYMNNIEIAPRNYGSEGEYDNIAGILLAFGYKLSLKKGLGNYKGYLVFDSKERLIPLYERKYGAIHTMGQSMYIDQHSGEKLIKKYLKNKLW